MLNLEYVKVTHLCVLNRCVQRMRRQIATEEKLVLAAASPTANSMNNVPNGLNKKTKKMLTALDRTPSFYTSRSLVNLSGLSVLDPMPSTTTPFSMNSGNGSNNKGRKKSVNGEEEGEASGFPVLQRISSTTPSEPEDYWAEVQ